MLLKAVQIQRMTSKYFTQNGRSCHFERKQLSISQLVTTAIFSQLEISQVLNGTTPEIQDRKQGP